MSRATNEPTTPNQPVEPAAGAGLACLLAELATRPAIWVKTNFAQRAEALDELDFWLPALPEHLPLPLPPSQPAGQANGLATSYVSQQRPPASPTQQLNQQAHALREELESIDNQLFQQLRAGIRAGRFTGAALGQRLRSYLKLSYSVTAAPGAAVTEYDSLDVLCNGLLPQLPLPVPTAATGPEMVYYQKTPARISWQLAGQLTPQDTLYDLGSGLGQVPLLARLLSGASARGLDIEPAYCRYAQACVADLRLDRVDFLAADVRDADLSGGSAFYLFTPFTGSILRQVLQQLRQVARQRPIRVFSYGPCTPAIAAQSWLHRRSPTDDPAYTLAAFSSH